jgi:vanillate O-demethylase ferredoxin subunit
LEGPDFSWSTLMSAVFPGRPLTAGPTATTWRTRLLQICSDVAKLPFRRRTATADDGTLKVRVRLIRGEAADIKSFELVSAHGQPLPPFTAGAHIEIWLDGGLVRHYSLCNAPGTGDAYVIAVKREAASRGGSRAMHELVKEGDELRIGTPRNQFPLQGGARHHLLLAAGIGITPLLSMAQHLQREGRSFELHYFTRSPADTAFRGALSRPAFGGKVHFHHGVGEGLRGLLRQLLWQWPQGHHLYMCGPHRFTRVVEEVTVGVWPPEAIHAEYFGADPAASAAPCQPFMVRLQRSDRSFEVPAHRSIAEVLEQHGMGVPTSCREGVCGTCVTGLVDGQADHRDAFLSDKERQAGDTIMVCVSRARSGHHLVLDL